MIRVKTRTKAIELLLPLGYCGLKATTRNYNYNTIVNKVIASLIINMMYRMPDSYNCNSTGSKHV